MDFDSLTPAQQRVASRVAVNQDLGENPKVLSRLEELGVIGSYYENAGGHPPLRIKRYRMPVAVHMAWCQWCTATHEEEDR